MKGNGHQGEHGVSMTGLDMYFTSGIFRHNLNLAKITEDQNLR